MHHFGYHDVILLRCVAINKCKCGYSNAQHVRLIWGFYNKLQSHVEFNNLVLMMSEFYVCV